MHQQSIEINVTEKRITVLVDLLNYGIVELPIIYNLIFCEREVRSCIVNCHIELSDASRHSWLCSPDFIFVFSEIPNGIGYAVSFREDFKKNIYYHSMLNVVSDYLVFKENFFRSTV